MATHTQHEEHFASDWMADTPSETDVTPFETGFPRYLKQKHAPIETGKYAIRRWKATPFETGNLQQAIDFIEEIWRLKGTSTYKINSEIFLGGI